ncbi:MAG TPA: SpoIIE family protein phosphatase [Solirubrobacteraceae bacterium]|nr:SpoIIE family protein phosphatase [Solirubrobacteraceae bacterium]
MTERVAAIDETVTAGALLDARAANALLDAFYAAIPAGLAFFTPDLRFERVNQALADMNGVPVEDHLGHSLEEVLGPHAERIGGYLREVLQTRRPVVDAEVAVQTPGEPGGRHWEASYFPVFAGVAELAGVGAVVREVTSSRRAEAERVSLLKSAVSARAHAEAAQVRSESALRSVEEARQMAERVRARNEFLAEAGRRMAVSMDFETTLKGVVESAVPRMADWCGITIMEPGGRLQTLAATPSDPAKTQLAWELTERYPSRLDEPSSVAKVIVTGEMELVAEITDEMLVAGARDEEHLRILRALDLRSILMVPLRTPGGILGVLSLAFAESGRSFTGEDISLATILAARAALHIRNAQLYTERSHIARTLQASLLPRRLPDVPGLELAARYRAAGDQNDVGGDFYDVFPSEEGSWAAVIGDVSGKGPEAAALTSLTRHTLRAASLQHSGPAENLRMLNRALLADTDTTRFSTVLYARLRPSEDGTLVTLASGGHPGPLVLRADGALERVDARGTLIGGVSDPTFEEHEVRLEHGDLMLLYTDGVTELRTRDPQFGERRLAETLGGLRAASAAQVADSVERMAVELQDGPPRDDIALLAVRVR